MMVFFTVMEDSSFVGYSVEDLFNHNGLENNNEDVESREQVSLLSDELPLGSIF